MAAQSGDVMAATLLRLLPDDLTEQLLGRMDASVSVRVRENLDTLPAQVSTDEIDLALAEFFDLLRLSDRGRALFTERTESGEYRPLARPPGGQAAAQPEPAPATDPITQLRDLPVEKLLKVLDGEPPAVTALILTVLDQSAAAAVLRGLPADQRVPVAVRYSQPGNRNYSLVQQLARAVAEKGKRLAEQPSETPADTRIAELAAMLRGLPRQERVSLFQAMGETDQQLTDRVKEKLFNFEDLLKLDDRSVQGLLAQLNIKTIATSLKGADEQMTAKVTNNISSRARELLQEEISLLGSVTPEQLIDARKEVVTLIRQGEEEGRFSLGE